MKVAKIYLFLLFLFQAILIHAQNTAPTGNNPSSIAFSPQEFPNLFAAVTNAGDNTVFVYLVDRTTGVLTPVAIVPTGANPQSVAFSPNAGGRLFAAVANAGDNTVSLYLVDTSTGDFLLVATEATGANPVSVAFSPVVADHLFLAVANANGNSIPVYQVDTTIGTLTPVSGSPFKDGKEPVSISISDVVDNSVFVSVAYKGSNEVVLYKISVTETSFPPKKLHGFKKFSIKHKKFVNVLTWKAPTKGVPIVSFQIYRNQINPNHLIGVVPNDHCLCFVDRHIQFWKTYTYYVVSVDALGNTSPPAKVVIRKVAPKLHKDSSSHSSSSE